MADEWTLERLLTFALGLSTLEALGPETIQELGEGLAFLAQEHAGIVRRQAATTRQQAATIETQAATIERLQDALQCLRPGPWLLGRGVGGRDMTPLACPHCGTMDTPVLAPGPSRHVLKASCAHCGHFLKLLPMALVRAAARAQRRQRVQQRRRMGR